MHNASASLQEGVGDAEGMSSALVDALDFQCWCSLREKLCGQGSLPELELWQD